MTGVDIDATPFSVSGLYDRQPPPLRLMVLADHQRQVWYVTGVDATSLRVVNIGAVEAEPGPGSTVDHLAQLTGLSTDRLAYALGASRRSLFNWRQGRSVRPDAEARIKRASSVVHSIVYELAPDSVRGWLETGDPPAIDLMHDGLWDELEERVTKQAQPIPVQPLTREADADGEPEVYGPETHTLLLQTFTTPRDVVQSRTGWRPQEHTGLGDQEADDE